MAVLSEKGNVSNRDILSVAVLILIDALSKNILSESGGAYCNPIGPWGTDIGNGVMILSAALSLLIVGFFRIRARSGRIRFASLLVLAGGFGNLFDRLIFGCVRDFSLVTGFPAFNVADVLLTIGGFLLVLFVFRGKEV